MGKADHKKLTGKESSVQERLGEKDWICVSDKWVKWAKRYMNKANRRKSKQELDKDMED